MKSNQKHILFLTLGWFGIQMAMALDATQFQVMLDEKLHDAFLIAAVLSLGPIAGIVVQPVIGLYGDMWQQHGISRQKLIRISLFLAILSTLALTLPMQTWPMIAMMGVFYFTFNILMVTYRAVVTQTAGRRALMDNKGLISGFTALFSGAGSFSMFVLCSLLSQSPYPFWIGAALLLGTFILFFQYAPKAKGQPGSEDDMKANTALFKPWNLLFYAIPLLGYVPGMAARIYSKPEHKAIFRLFCVVFFSWIGIKALRDFFVLYVIKELALDYSAANQLLALLTLVMVGAAVPLGTLADRMENRLLYRYALLFFAIVCFAAYALVNDFASAAVMSILLGVSFAGMIVFPLSLLFKLCPAQSEGTYAGLYNLFLSVPQLYGLYLTGWLIEQNNDYRVIMPVAGVAVLMAFGASFLMTREEGKPSVPPPTQMSLAERV